MTYTLRTAAVLLVILVSFWYQELGPLATGAITLGKHGVVADGGLSLMMQVAQVG